MMSNNARENKVSFTDVTTRTFDLCIGDSPSVTRGVPVALAWTYTESPPLSLNEFESVRSHPRRTKDQMKMSAEVRNRKLVEDFGVPASQIQRKLSRSVVSRGVYPSNGSMKVKPVTSRTSPPGGYPQHMKESLQGFQSSTRPLVLSSLSRRIATSKAAWHET